MAKRNPLTPDEQAVIVRKRMDEESLTIDEYIRQYGSTASLKEGVEIVRKAAKPKPEKARGSGPAAPSFVKLTGSRLS